MAVVVMLMLMQSKRGLRRSRIIRDRTNPLDTFDDVEMYSKFRFRRHDILSMVDEIKDELEMANRGYTVLPCIQVCVALRFYATGSFQSACADLADENAVIYIVICQQFICNADMLFIDVVAKWPGSVHDARILRQSRFFSAFEASPRPVDGTMLADSAYMMREWLMTPYENPAT
ncbi:hypothetical protein C0Q70_06868 [Pomacea canaliculata]|uniref:DDE Tnp4 domain-containing protein n=1 Tax=Pomacea canaliculata TaxID=400727 RepID=A0A2T7PDF6_POMCA|nr:hypothetical protein C0Q70_06868 [Pomacea canaliculata]